MASYESFHDDLSFGSAMYSAAELIGETTAKFDESTPVSEAQKPLSESWARLQAATRTLGLLGVWKQVAEEGRRARLVLHVMTVLCLQVTNIIIHEYMLKKDKNALDLVTFGNYVFVTVISISQAGMSILFKRKIPLYLHLAKAAVGACERILCNAAFRMGLPMLIVLVVKDAGLPLAMLVGFLASGQRFSTIQVGAVVIVTLGILRTVLSKPDSRTDDQAISDYNLLLAVMLLVASLLAGQASDLLDAYAVKKHGRHVNELIFYNRVLGIPILLSTWSGRELFNQAWMWTTERTEDVFGFGYAIPVLWLLLFVNMLNCYILCVSSSQVFILSNGTVLSLVYTVQRTVNTILTAVYNSPPWPSFEMWFGVLHVFAGASAFTLAPKIPVASEKVE